MLRVSVAPHDGVLVGELWVRDMVEDRLNQFGLRIRPVQRGGILWVKAGLPRLSILELHDVNEHLHRIGKIVSLEEAPWVLVLGGRLSNGIDPRMTVGPHPRVFSTPSNSL